MGGVIHQVETNARRPPSYAFVGVTPFKSGTKGQACWCATCFVVDIVADNLTALLPMMGDKNMAPTTRTTVIEVQQ